MPLHGFRKNHFRIHMLLLQSTQLQQLHKLSEPFRFPLCGSRCDVIRMAGTSNVTRSESIDFAMMHWKKGNIQVDTTLKTKFLGFLSSRRACMYWCCPCRDVPQTQTLQEDDPNTKNFNRSPNVKSFPLLVWVLQQKKQDAHNVKVSEGSSGRQQQRSCFCSLQSELFSMGMLAHPHCGKGCLILGWINLWLVQLQMLVC